MHKNIYGGKSIKTYTPYYILSISVIILLIAIRYRRKIKTMIISSIDNEWVSSFLENKKERQLRYLLEIHPKYRKVFSNIIKEIEKRGYEVYPTSAYRDFKKQEELYNKGITPAKFSMHNFGLAMDFILKKDGKTYADKKTPKEVWIKTGVPDIIKKYNLTWGGDFPGYYDPVHVGLDNKYKIKDLIKAYYSGNVFYEKLPDKYKDIQKPIKFVHIT